MADNIMRPFYLIAAVAAVVSLSTACEGTRDALGMTRQSPDEFAVYQRAPLSLPPDYGLRPPIPGSRDASRVTPTDNARSALLTSPAPTEPSPVPTAASSETTQPGALATTATNAPAVPSPSGQAISPGTLSLLSRTGGLDADPEIRAQINRETTILAEADQSFTERLMFWSSDGVVYGTVVDPKAEAHRIQENQALGKPLTEGVTPTIERKRRAILEGIF
jgi:Protein of unknown function (DUF3035)